MARDRRGGAPPQFSPRTTDSFARNDNSRLDNGRREKLISLLDALHELAQDDPKLQAKYQPRSSLDAVKDLRSNSYASTNAWPDGRTGKRTAETFHSFRQQISNFDKELRRLTTAARQLGGTVGILSSAFTLRERLAQIKYLFQENTADLFPGKVQRQPRETLVSNLLDWRSARRKSISLNMRQPVMDDDLDSELIPKQLEDFAVDIITFLKCLNEFPEFTDEVVDASFHAFEADLTHWAESLKEFKGQLKYRGVQKYIHGLMSEMGDHIDIMSSSLSMLIEIGIPSVVFNQQHDAINLNNMSTVAIFFSAVTATTLQYSYQQTNDWLSSSVNAFWFASLVLSIAAAINSLLGVTWKQALYRSPGHQCPKWILLWIRRIPLVFLIFSVVCFSAGLVCFTYSTPQGIMTSTVTLVITTLTHLGLLIVLCWFGFEKWIFMRFMGQKWLRGEIADVANDFRDLGRKAKQSVGRPRLSARWSWLGSFMKSRTDIKHADDRSVLPMVQLPSGPHLVIPAGESVPTVDVNSACTDSRESPVDEPESPKAHFRSAVHKVMVANALTKPNPSPISKRKHSTESIPKLKSLAPRRDISNHDAPVRHMQFSPDGKLLATCSLDRTSVLFSVGDIIDDTLSVPCVLPHTSVSRVAWSPGGDLLLTKTNRSIKVWTRTGCCEKTINRQRAIQCISWLPGGEAFLSVERDEVVKLDLDGNVLGTFVPQSQMMIRCITITPDSCRLIGVGYPPSNTSRHGSDSKGTERRFFVYNLQMQRMESHNPIPHNNEVRDIVIDKEGLCILVSYEYKAAPQLWKFDVTPIRMNSTETTAKLLFHHKYIPTFAPIDFAGPSCFGGKDDELVLCAGRGGDMYIWERESARMVQHIRAPAWDNGDLTCIAWNDAEEDRFTFATGSHHGPVRVWTTTSVTRPDPSQWLPNSPTSTSIPLRSHSPDILNDHDGDRTILRSMFTLPLVASPIEADGPSASIFLSGAESTCEQ